jgi:hypothetical protein
MARNFYTPPILIHDGACCPAIRLPISPTSPAHAS